jgi:hypothetical protein
LSQRTKPTCTLGEKSTPNAFGIINIGVEPSFFACESFKKPNTASLFQKPLYMFAHYRFKIKLKNRQREVMLKK